MYLAQEAIRGLQRTVDRTNEYIEQTTSKVLIDLDEQVPIEEFSTAAIQDLQLVQ